MRAYLGEWTRREPSCDNEVWGAELTAMVLDEPPRLRGRVDGDASRRDGDPADLRPTRPTTTKAMFVLAQRAAGPGDTGRKSPRCRERIAKLRRGGTLSAGEAGAPRPKRGAAAHRQGARGGARAAGPCDRCRLKGTRMRGRRAPTRIRSWCWRRARRKTGSGRWSCWPRRSGGTAPIRCVLGAAVEDRAHADRRARRGWDAGGTLLGGAGPAPQVECGVSGVRRRCERGCPDATRSRCWPARRCTAGPDLLPSELAWSYRSGRPRTGQADRRPQDRHLRHRTAGGVGLGAGGRVAFRRAARPVAGGPGGDARRERWRRCADAGSIEIHAHGLVNLAISDASFLVLSPEADGRYALTAADIRRRETARASRWSSSAPATPHAPLHTITGPGAWPRHSSRLGRARSSPRRTRSRMRTRASSSMSSGRGIRRGQSPAVALRDRRREWMKSHSASDWVKRLMVFQ